MIDRLNILYLTDRIGGHGGADAHLSDVMAAVAQHHSIAIATGRIDDDTAVPTDTPITRLSGLSRPTASQKGLDGLDALLADADVVHVQNIMNPEPLGQATATGKTVVTVQDHRVFCPGPGRTLPNGQRCTERMAASTCTQCLPDAVYRQRTLDLTEARLAAIDDARLVVLSQYMADELAIAGRCDAEVVHPWIEPAPRPSGPGHGVMLAGRLVQHKGMLAGQEAWLRSETKQPLLVAGAGPQAQLLSDAQHLGWMARPALRQALAEARCLLFPSQWQEPFGIVGVEALSVGTPVVVMDRGGTAEWSHSGCIPVDPGDIQAMSAAITTLCEQPDSAAALGRAGWEMVRNNFTKSAILPSILEIYRESASRSKH